MLNAIRHRGPDDEGMFVEGPVGIGMRRLSIIDLAGGHQPIFDEARTRAIVFNGEIYNYRALRADLESRHRFGTASDTETIVHLHEELGARCVERLRGMFAFALWNAQQRELLLARDRFGIKPLYYHEAPWGLAFASELKALLAGGFVSTALDWEGLESVFRLGYIPAPRSPFETVKKLEPGHVLRWRPGQPVRIEAYWDVPTARGPAPRDVDEMVLARLDESVQSHLVADVPVAAFLSGGLDSSAVVASMARGGGKAHAYTVRYQGSGAAAADESGLATALARRYGVNLTVIDVQPDIRQIFEPIVLSMDEPHGDESVVPTWLICERVARDYKVALVGTGGDELFAGYRRHFGLGAAALWQRAPKPLRDAARFLGHSLPEPSGGGLGIARLKRFLRISGASLASRYLGLQDRLGDLPLFAADLRPEMDRRYAQATFERFAARAPTDGLVRPALYLDYKTYLPDDLLHLADRISMAHSLELRVPFVDHELVEALFPIPDRIRIGAGRPKRMLRSALRSRLPREHFRAPKRGFVGPTAMWLRHELAEMVTDELSPDRMRSLGYFDPGVVERLVREHLTQRQNHEGVLWALLGFSTWHRAYVERRPAPAGPALATTV